MAAGVDRRRPSACQSVHLVLRVIPGLRRGDRLSVNNVQVSLRVVLVSHRGCPHGLHSPPARPSGNRSNAAEQEEEGEGPPEPFEPIVAIVVTVVVVTTVARTIVVPLAIDTIAEVIGVHRVVHDRATKLMVQAFIEKLEDLIVLINAHLSMTMFESILIRI